SMSVSATVSALSGKDQAIVAATGSPRPSSSRACGVMVSYSSRLSGAVISIAIVRLKSPGPNLPQASAAASTKTPPTQLPPLPLPGDRGRGGRRVRASAPRRLGGVGRRRGRVGGVVAQGQAVRGEGRVVVALAFEGERLVQIIEALGIDVVGARAAEQAAPETHGPKIACGRATVQCSFTPHACPAPGPAPAPAPAPR